MAESLEKLNVEIEQRYGLREIADEDDAPAPPPIAAPARPRSDLRHEHAPPAPPFWGSRVIEHIPLKAALSFINETMLFQVQWGFRKKGRSTDAWKAHINTEIRPKYRELVERCERENILACQAVYGFWPCNSDGDDLVVYAPPAAGAAPAGLPGPSSLREHVRFTFPRQSKAPHWCLSDFWRPRASGRVDVAAFQIVTAGRRVSEVARQWFAANEYQQYLFLHGLGVETAEALAEYVHRQIRAELGFGGDDARELQALFKQGYRGSRFSFGYPACPRLEDQEKLMQLLAPQRIGVELSEGFQLEPEQSTSAIVAHHPEARYFNVR